MVVAGIDVGGVKKGFHVVALRKGTFFQKLKSRNTSEIVEWCRNIEADVVAVDAPCKWRAPNSPVRLAERDMAAEGIGSYYAPTGEIARVHSFYSWMLR